MLHQLNSTDNNRIKNPLAGIPRETLLQNVADFAQEKGLSEHTFLLQKGALVAQNPANYANIPGDHALSITEKDCLRLEVEKKWAHPLQLYLTIFVCSIGACVQGWDQTGSNGANLSWPQVFGVSGSDFHDTMIVGLVNSAPYIVSALFGCWISDPLNLYIGRRGTIFFSGIFCLFPVFFQGLCQSWEQLFVCRLLLGIGMGAKGSTVPIFAAENSPAAIRGALTMSWQMWTAFGIFLGLSANLALAKIEHLAWRFQLGAASLPAIPLLLLIFLCPESPRWLMKKNRYQNAYKSLLRLRNNPLQAARDLYSIHCQLEIEKGAMGKNNYVTRAVQLFTVPRNRRATLASFVVMIAQQMCKFNSHIMGISSLSYQNHMLPMRLKTSKLTDLYKVASTSSPSTRRQSSRILASPPSTLFGHHGDSA